MALSEIEAVCRHCRNWFRAQPTRTFLGFAELKCSSCGKVIAYPLTTGYRIIYWIMFPFMTAAFALSLSHGEIQLTGLAAVGILIALARDWQLRRQVAAERGSARLP